MEAPFPFRSVGGNFLWREKTPQQQQGRTTEQTQKTDKQTGTMVGRPDVEVIGLSLRKLAYIFNTRLKHLETLERRLKNFETLFRTSDLEFVVATTKNRQNSGRRTN